MYSVLGAFLSVFLLVSCNYYESKISATSGGPPVVPGKVNFASVTRDIIAPYCLRCHQGDEPADGMDLTMSYEELVKTGMIEPGKPEDSRLYVVIEEGGMPKKGAKPTAAQIKMLKKWIEDGATKE